MLIARVGRAHLGAWGLVSFLSQASFPACAVRGLLAGRVPPEGPWELQGIELLSQNELYRQILLLLHLLPQDLLLLQVKHPFQTSLLLIKGTWFCLWPILMLLITCLCHTDIFLSTALPVFLLLLPGGPGPSHPVWASDC